MSSATLQSRIKAFETLAQSGAPLSTPPPVVNGVKPATKRTPNILDSPVSPTASSFSPIQPSRISKRTNASPSPSPPNLGRKTSLIDLKDWVVDDGPTPGRQSGEWNGHTGAYKPYQRTTRRSIENGPVRPKSTAPLIHLESAPPPSSFKLDNAPPLPPRKQSYTSLRSVSSGNASGTTALKNGTPLHRSDSLTVEHTYPPLSRLGSDNSQQGRNHAPASSISSFHSISLSSDSGVTDGGQSVSVSDLIATFSEDKEESIADTNSLDESFENVSTSSVISPTRATFEWERPGQKQHSPPLPQRSNPKLLPSRSVVKSLPVAMPPPPRSNTSSSTARRVPPPPPTNSGPPLSIRPPSSGPPSSRASLTSTSDRSSILSTTSRTSSSTHAVTQKNSKAAALVRPTPIPAAATRRYEAVFVGNISEAKKWPNISEPTLLSPPGGTRKSRSAAGWRGLSVDLITNPDEHPLASQRESDSRRSESQDGFTSEERLDGKIVKQIWSTSKLDTEKLRDIWRECDPSHSGSLDRDAFVKGMWRIDEELRRAQLIRQTGSSSRMRSPPRSRGKPMAIRQ